MLHGARLSVTGTQPKLHCAVNLCYSKKYLKTIGCNQFIFNLNVAYFLNRRRVREDFSSQRCRTDQLAEAVYG